MAEEKSKAAKGSRLSEDLPGTNAQEEEDIQQRGLEEAARERQERQTDEDEPSEGEGEAGEQPPGRTVAPENSEREHEGGV